MKKISLLVSFFALTLNSCTKQQDIVKTFTGNLPIVLTNSPTTTAVGQNIIVNVRCELTSLSGSVYFQGFDIKEISENKFDITASALYKNWNTQIATPVMWTLDTIANIKTTTTGKYVFKLLQLIEFI